MVCFLKKLDFFFFFTGSPLDKEMEHQSLYVLAYVPDAPSKLIDNENLFQLFFTVMLVCSANWVWNLPCLWLCFAPCSFWFGSY